jgi:mono/diheme cytochrome c family protein
MELVRANRWVVCALLAAGWLAVQGPLSCAQETGEPAPASAGQRPEATEAQDGPSENQPAPAPAGQEATGAVGFPPTDPPPSEGAVSFLMEVQPIFAKHCVSCHGPEMVSGGLRLDTREEALRGGDSGKPIVGGSLQSNELWARVSSDVAAYRMPKNAPPLSAEEIDILRRWIEQGSVWPLPAEPPMSTFDWPVIKYFTELADRYEFEYQYVLPWGVAYLGLMFALLVVLRVRAAYSAGRKWASGRLGSWCGRVSSTSLLLIVLAANLGFALAFARAHIVNLQGQLAKAIEIKNRNTSSWAKTVFGYPPKPIRSPGPKHLSATYYRGNCERNEKLFNGGNYLTCTFHINLCDRNHQPVHVGDPVPPDGLFVRCEIERAPGTTDLLYSPEGMASVFLLDRFVERHTDRGESELVRLETLEPGQRWVAYVPIKPQPHETMWSGTIYMYTGRVTETQLNGNPHYGIGYEITIRDGKIAPQSDLWMDSFGNPAFEPPRKTPLLPYEEWFGERPLPVIVGENTDDPTLLGVDEHVRKGLIPPPEKTQPQTPSPPSTDSAPPADKTPQDAPSGDD